MKKLNFRSFTLGILFSATLLTVFAFTQKIDITQRNSKNSTIKAVVGNSVTPTQAAQYRSNFEKNFPQSIKAVNISRQQLDALNQTATALGSNMRNVSGFRLYFGSLTTNPESQIVSLAYSINNNLDQNAPGETLQMADGFDRAYSQQCPPFCD